MAAITTTSIYNEQVRYRFDERKSTSARMRAAIDHAFLMSPVARQARLHDFDLAKPVRMMAVVDYYLTTAYALAQDVIVLTQPGGHLMLYLVDIGPHYECLVGSAHDVREFVSRTLAPSYTRLAYDAQRGVWNDTFNVDGLKTLHCPDDGAFCGAAIDGTTLTYTGKLVDTTALWMLDINEHEADGAAELPNLTAGNFVAAVMRIEEAQAA